MTAAACLICQSALERPPTGRPPTYCSPGCRRAGEYERERLQRRLERLEDSAVQWRAWGNNDRQLAAVEGEIKRATARLLALLGADDGVSPASADGGG